MHPISAEGIIVLIKQQQFLSLLGLSRSIKDKT